MDAFKVIEKSHMAFKLSPFSVRQLLFLDKAPADIYGLKNNMFTKIIKANTVLNREIIRELIAEGQIKIFIYTDEAHKLISAQQENLRRITRSLSIGDPLKNAKLQMNLLTIHMEFLYQDPTNDDILNLQAQSIKNLAVFLIQNIGLHEKLYNEYIKQKHHFIFAQPMISSLFLTGVLKISKMYSDREIELLFITSYFKDIGMSAIPVEKYNQKDLSQKEKQIFNNHPLESIKILNGRISLGPNHIKIIENHHTFSLLQKELLTDPAPSAQFITGTETVLVNCMDIIAAMITGRPYREATNLFDALDFVRVLVSDEYAHEFRYMVNYFKSFKESV